MAVKVLGFAGSTRTESMNRRLLAHVLEKVAGHGAETQTFEFRDCPMPLYDGDAESEEGMPDTVLGFRAAVMGADALVIASPEYNASYSALLKNAIDWGSRSDRARGQGNVFSDKVVLLVAASPGGFGGVRGLRHVREALSELGAIVLPQQVGVGNGASMFGDDGELANERSRKFLDDAVSRLVTVTERLSQSE